LTAVCPRLDDGLLPARVLIVDDAPVFRQVARELLERRGYTVVGEAGSAASAVDAVEWLAPDAVLLDVGCPIAAGSSCPPPSRAPTRSWRCCWSPLTVSRPASRQ
jgi:PleD family two-component response regulator